MHLKLSPKGSDWTPCPTCHQSMSASYQGKPRCLRCVQPSRQVLSWLSTHDLKKAAKYKIAEAE